MELSFLSNLAKEAAASKTPGWGQFELTPICNLKCRMCYVHKPEEDRWVSGRLLPASFWLEAAKQAAQQGMLVLSLTGGEILTYPYLEELMEGLGHLGLLISFNTNGTLVDEKRVAWFKRYPPTKINISLYGASDETYKALTGMADGFTRVSRGVELLQQAGLNVYLNAVLVPENIRELPQMHRWAAEHGLVLHTTSYIFPARGCQGCGADTHRLSPEAAAEAACFDKLVTLGKTGFRQSAANTAFLLDRLEQAEQWEPDKLECRAGVCSFGITWDGHLQPCVLFGAIRIPLTELSFAEGWQQLVEKVAAVPVPDKCADCRKKELCPVCKAAVYQETAGHTQPPQYLCDYTQHMADLLRREGQGVAVTLQNRRDFHPGGCSD